jgi:DNA-binding XRE family transcriptional regulator
MPTPDLQGPDIQPEARLDVFVRQRSAQLGLSLTELCRRAGISRQTLYELERLPHKLPSLTTVVALAQVLDVHPMRLLQFVFELVPMKSTHRRARAGDRSAFVADITCPDGTAVGPGQRFEKIWSLQNVGTVPWTGRALQCRDDEVAIYDTVGARVLVSPGLRPDQRTVPLPDVAPGETVSVAVWFTAPGQPCSAISYWKLVDADGRLCFPAAAGLWVQVRVVALAASAFANTVKSA